MKTKHRILSVLTILALVASLSAVMVAPAGAIAAFGEPTIDDNDAGDVAVYEISFIPGDTIEAEDVITITFPDDTDLTDVGIGDVTADDGAEPPLGVALVAESDELLIIRLDRPVAAGLVLTITIQGVTNTDIPGRYRLRVRTTDEPDDVESAAFDIEGFTIDPAKGAVGDTVTAFGAGFADDQTVWVYHDEDRDGLLDEGETVFATTTTDGDGVFSVEFQVTADLEQPVGEVDARDGAGTNMDWIVGEEVRTFDVEPSITLDTPSVPRGGMVQFDGINFNPPIPPILDADAEVLFDAVGWVWILPGFLDAGETAFQNAEVRMFFGAPWGDQQMTVWIDSNDDGVVDPGEEASVTIEVVEGTLTLDPPIGLGRQLVTAEGANLAPDWLFGVWFDTNDDGEVDAGEILETDESNNAGDVSISFVLPDNVAIDETFQVALIADVDEDGIVEVAETQVASTTFSTPAAALELDPISGAPGDRVLVSGTGGPIEATVDVYFDDLVGPWVPPIFLGTLTTNTIGEFEGRFTIPLAEAGDHEIEVWWADAVQLEADFEIIEVEVVVTVADGLREIQAVLDHSVWLFRDGEWYQYHTDPAIHALIPEGQRLEVLERGEAYWIYLTEDITDVFFGGMERTLSAGWHNIGWLD
ncbi:hypothetical protein M1O52_04945 [Dehalococcoidia bacterium]|nr:hypothetical protein [Dehalococcoidia bacterium]